MRHKGYTLSSSDSSGQRVLLDHGQLAMDPLGRKTRNAWKWPGLFDQVKRMKELEAENARLRRAVSDLTLDKMILVEAAKGNF